MVLPALYERGIRKCAKCGRTGFFQADKGRNWCGEGMLAGAWLMTKQKVGPQLKASPQALEEKNRALQTCRT
jgi:hypothetical protein